MWIDIGMFFFILFLLMYLNYLLIVIHTVQKTDK